MFKSLSTIDCARGRAIESLAWSVPKLYSDYEFLNGFLYGKVNQDGLFSGKFIKMKSEIVGFKRCISSHCRRRYFMGVSRPRDGLDWKVSLRSYAGGKGF